MLIEYCEDCGSKQPLVWWSGNALWERLTNHATPNGDNAAGILCPRCFDRRATDAGLLLRWRPEIEYGTALRGDARSPTDLDKAGPDNPNAESRSEQAVARRLVDPASAVPARAAASPAREE